MKYNISVIDNLISIEGVGSYPHQQLSYEIDGVIFRIFNNRLKLIGRVYSEFGSFPDITSLESHFLTIKSQAQSNLDTTTSDNYINYFTGVINVRKGRWYGLNIDYGKASNNMSYTYDGEDFDTLPNIDSNKGVGVLIPINSTLKKIVVHINEASREVDNLQFLVNIISKTSGNSTFTVKNILHQKLKNDGYLIESNKSYVIEISMDEVVVKNEIIQVLVNSSSSKSSTVRLYGASIDLILNY